QGARPVTPMTTPASSVPPNPIGGANPFANPAQSNPFMQGARQMGPTPPPNGYRPNPQQGSPISSIVSGIIAMPAHVVQGVKQGLNAYATPGAWTNTPGQVNQMSSNIANGQPPSPPANPPAQFGGAGQPTPSQPSAAAQNYFRATGMRPPAGWGDGY